jgi:hypothetical protein
MELHYFILSSPSLFFQLLTEFVFSAFLPSTAGATTSLEQKKQPV